MPMWPSPTFNDTFPESSTAAVGRNGPVTDEKMKDLTPQP